jgi:hypothetical protein
MQQERTSLENSVSKSEGVSNSEGERVDKGYSGGASIGLSAGSGGGNGGNKIEFKNKILDKVADVVGISGSLNGGMHYNNNSSSETVSSNRTQLTNDQAFAKETIDYLNKKYDNKYMKDNMDVVFKDANEFQKTLAGTKDVDSTKTIYTYGKEALTPNSGVKAEAMTKELDEFEKSLKDKK